MINPVDIPEPLRPFLERPPLYAHTDPLFWDDPHISKGMLQAHFDETTDLASYRPEKRQHICDWIAAKADVSEGSHVLDLGCGPGHYTEIWAARGCGVTGIDLSPRSIEAARKSATEKGLDIDYRLDDYCKADLGGPFDLATIVSCDFGVLLPMARVNVATKISDTLGPNGVFAFDVLSEAHAESLDVNSKLEALEEGFWSPKSHHVLSQTWVYNTQQCMLNQFAVMSEQGDVRVFRRWEQMYSAVSLAVELNASGFDVSWIGDDLCGTTYSGQSSVIGALAMPRRQSEVLTFPKT